VVLAIMHAHNPINEISITRKNDMIFKKSLCALVFGLAMVGCATPLTQDARMTREINKDWRNKCKHITTEEVWSTWKFGAKGNYLEVRDQIRIMTAERGGNAFVVGDFSGDGMGHYGAIFEVYHCDHFET